MRYADLLEHDDEALYHKLKSMIDHPGTEENVRNVARKKLDQLLMRKPQIAKPASLAGPVSNNMPATVKAPIEKPKPQPSEQEKSQEKPAPRAAAPTRPAPPQPDGLVYNKFGKMVPTKKGPTMTPRFG